MNHPFPNGQYYYGNHPYYPWNSGYSQLGIPETPSSAGENYISSQWHAGFSPILVILAVTTGILAWMQYGAQVVGSKKVHGEILSIAIRAGGILILLSIAVNILGQSAAVSHSELTYQHMLMVFLVCTLLWNYVASSIAGGSKGPDDQSGDAKPKSSLSKSSSSSSRTASSPSSRPTGSSRDTSSRSSSSAKLAEGASSGKSASASSGASAPKSSSSRSSSSSAEPSRTSSSSRSGDPNEKDPDPWEKSHPSAHLSTTGKDRPRVWPFPIGYDQARPAGQKKLWWESGLPHVVGTIHEHSKTSSTSSAGGTPEAKSDDKSESRPQPSVPATSSGPPRIKESSMPPDVESKSEVAAQSVKDPEDRRQREKLKAAYLEMKKDPNTDPEKLAKLKKLLSSSTSTSVTKPDREGEPLTRSVDKAPNSAGESEQDKKDLLIAQYMHLKGNPKSDPAELKRLKSLIADFQIKKDTQLGQSVPSVSQNKVESLGDVRPKSKDEINQSGDISSPVVSSDKAADSDKEQQRRQLKELYSKLKADPNADPRKLEKVKMAILKLDNVRGTLPAAKGTKDAPGESSSPGRPEPAKANASVDPGSMDESRIGERRCKNLRHLQMAICVAAVAILNIQIGFLCGVGFAIYLVEDMINPIPLRVQSSPHTAGGSSGEVPSRTSRSSDGKTSSSSSSSSSTSSSSKRTLTDAEKASLPTSTGRSKEKDKTERLPPISMMYMATPSPITPHVWTGPDFPLAIQGTSSALVSSVYTP